VLKRLERRSTISVERNDFTVQDGLRGNETLEGRHDLRVVVCQIFLVPRDQPYTRPVLDGEGPVAIPFHFVRLADWQRRGAVAIIGREITGRSYVTSLIVRFPEIGIASENSTFPPFWFSSLKIRQPKRVHDWLIQVGRDARVRLQ
jgi:hypothetical protein